MTQKQPIQQVLIIVGVAVILVFWFNYFQTNRVISQLQNNEAQKLWWQENYEMVQKLYNSEWFKQQQKAGIQQALGQIEWWTQKPVWETTTPSANSQWDETTETKKISLEQLKRIKDDSLILWNKDAKILIVEYSDLQCPFCKRHFESKTLESIISKYNGNVAKTMRQFPLGFHQYAQKAWEWAECFAQNSAEKYFKFVWAVFAKDLNSNWSDQTIYDVNKELWWNESSFKTCVESWKNTQKIKDQQAEWTNLFGITWTPGNVIINTENGEYVVLAWAYPVNQFEAIIDKLLK